MPAIFSQPMASIYSRFAVQIGNLQAQAENSSEAIKGIVQRQWRWPDGWITPVYDIHGYAPPFTRAEMNSEYPLFYITLGTTNDCKATKWQAVHLGGQERAFRLQEQSGIRCAMHAAARRAGQADTANGSFARIVDHIVDFILEGRTV